jgi:hypothetical protein
MAPWEWVVLAGLLLLAGVVLYLRLTGRPVPTVPDWVDQPPYYPTR